MQFDLDYLNTSEVKKYNVRSSNIHISTHVHVCGLSYKLSSMEIVLEICPRFKTIDKMKLNLYLNYI